MLSDEDADRIDKLMEEYKDDDPVVKTSLISDLDKSYHPTVLTHVRDFIHKNIVTKRSLLQKKDYCIYFDVNMKNDISFTAGKPITIVINASPSNGPLVTKLCKEAFDRTAILKQLQRTNQVVRQKDAMVWWGIDLDSIHEHEANVIKALNSTRYTSELLSTTIKLQVTDNKTGKSITVVASNTDVFTLERAAIKQLRSD